MILLVGASASGKSEIAKYLLSKYKMKKAITHTSRLPRVGEVDGVDYHFVSKKTFLKLWDEGKLIEDTLYNGNYYGCSKAEIGDDKCVILDPNGLKAFLALNNPTLITFFIKASKETREKRMRERGDDEESIKRRLESDDETFSLKNINPVDFIIENEGKSIEEIGDYVYKIYKEELNKRI